MVGWIAEDSEGCEVHLQKRVRRPLRWRDMLNRERKAPSEAEMKIGFDLREG
jgi:hypothetical protein